MPKECFAVRAFTDKCLSEIPTRKKTVKVVEKRVGAKVITKFKVKTCTGLHTLSMGDREKAIKFEATLKKNCDVQKLVEAKKKKN